MMRGYSELPEGLSARMAPIDYGPLWMHVLSRSAHLRRERQDFNVRTLIKAIVLVVILMAAPVQAQQPVEPWADYASYGTAFANPTIAAVQAWRSNDRACRFGQLAISEAVSNGVALTIKHFVVSARPCIGCARDGMPSGHSANAMVGFSAWNPGIGLGFAFSTGGLRHEANRHFWNQIGAGLALGLAAEGAGHLLRCKD